MEDDNSSDCGTGWKALAELQYENRDYPAAYDTGGRLGGWVAAAGILGFLPSLAANII